MGHLDHKAQAPASTRCYVLTISDTRTADTDTSGSVISELLRADGHQIAGRRLVPDEPAEVRATIQQQLSNPDVEVIITTGGTGLSKRDSTHEAIQALLEKRLEGFGELFRMLSYQEIGAAAKQFQLPSNKAAKVDPNVPDFKKIKFINYDYAKYGASAERRRLIAKWEKDVNSLPR